MLPAEIRGDAAGEIAGTRLGRGQGALCRPRRSTSSRRYAPGFARRFSAARSFSPTISNARIPNLVGGDSLSGSHHLTQNFLFRPIPGWSRWNTPVKDLYLIGAATWPGAGTGAGSGFMLAQDAGGR